MSDPLLNRVRTFLAAQALLRSNALLLVAVSGGPDSLGLLHLLWRLQAGGGPQLHVAHLDHGTRGAQGAAEAAAVAATATAWGLPVTVGRRPVPALARRRGAGLMAAAREARYEFLAATALATDADALVVAHQADDQAETVLLHALRGAGPAGLRGMRSAVAWQEWAAQRAEGGSQEAGLSPLAPPLIRPLLATSRAEIVDYCAAQALVATDDPTNRAMQYTRSRVRSLLPSLAAENPRLVAALGRTAQICADDYDFMQQQLAAEWPALASEQPGAVALRREHWAGLHPALQRYALRRAAAQLGASELSLAQIEAARTTSAAGSGRRLPLGSALCLEISQTALTIIRLADPPRAQVPQLHVDELFLAATGRWTLDEGWVCLVQASPPVSPTEWWTALDADTLDGPLVLRRRRPGDRFRPLGGPGSRRLQDFFVDRKVSQALRKAWPILATPAAVVWVAGLRADERFVAGAQTQHILWVGLMQEEAL